MTHTNTSSHGHQGWTVAAPAQAKVNLLLAVGAPRPDGFHPLVTVFQSLALSSTVTLSTPTPLTIIDPRREQSLCSRHAAYSGELPGPQTSHTPQLVTGITVTGLMAEHVPTGPHNLVHQAIVAVDDAYRREGVTIDWQVHAAIDKAIPVAGGMAGGSADAAAAVAACCGLARRAGAAPLPRDVVDEILVTLGSDVPFAARGGTAVATGRGEHLVDVACPGRLFYVIATQSEGLSTPMVFATFDEMLRRGEITAADMTPSIADDMVSAVSRGDITAVARAMRNDLEQPALRLRPALRDLLDEGQAAGALRAMVSGSGPSCFFLCDGADTARQVAAHLDATGLCDRTITTTGPGVRLDTLVPQQHP